MRKDMTAIHRKQRHGQWAKRGATLAVVIGVSLAVVAHFFYDWHDTVYEAAKAVPPVGFGAGLFGGTLAYLLSRVMPIQSGER